MAKRKKGPATHGGARAGAGRPRAVEGQECRAVSLYLPVAAIEALDEQATAAGLSRSAFLVQLLGRTKAIGPPLMRSREKR